LTGPVEGQVAGAGLATREVHHRDGGAKHRWGHVSDGMCFSLLTARLGPSNRPN
jgi:hypothetical protein